jgi:hypothetical protein
MKYPGSSDCGAAPLGAVKHVLNGNRQHGIEPVSKAVVNADDRPDVLTEEAATATP